MEQDAMEQAYVIILPLLAMLCVCAGGVRMQWSKITVYIAVHSCVLYRVEDAMEPIYHCALLRTCKCTWV